MALKFDEQLSLLQKPAPELSAEKKEPKAPPVQASPSEAKK